MSYDAVVLSGGGVRGIMHLGVLHYYAETGQYDHKYVHTYAGTSVGSAIALCLACGLEPMAVFQTLYTAKGILSARPQDQSLVDLITNFGLMSMDSFIDLVQQCVLTKMSSVPTLLELYQKTGKTLIVSVTNVNHKRVEYLTHMSNPHLSALDAVRMSCSLPLIFPRIKYKDCWYWDGGLTDNIPIRAVKNASNILLSVTIGTDMTLDPEYFVAYIYRAVTIPIGALTRLRYQCYQEMDHVTTVVSKADNISLVTFDIPAKTKMDLFLTGYNEARWMDSKEELHVEGWTWEVSVTTEPSDGWSLMERTPTKRCKNPLDVEIA